MFRGGRHVKSKGWLIEATQPTGMAHASTARGEHSMAKAEVHIRVDSSIVEPTCVRFIYQSIHAAEKGHNYTLKLVKHSIDREMLSYAELLPTDAPDEPQVRKWVYAILTTAGECPG
jgi:hypothetical protein